MLSRLDPHTWLILGPIVLLSLTVHEYAHGRVAESRGDPTARMLGRVTLNPLSHIDPIGALMFLFAGFGWARPVPYDPRYFRDPRRDSLLVALAGPASNVLLAFVMGLFLRLGVNSGVLGSFLFYGVTMNLAFAFFNLLPIPPLDGSKVAASVLPPNLAREYFRFEPYAPIILILLILPGIVGGFSPIWMVIGPLVSLFSYAFTGIGA